MASHIIPIRSQSVHEFKPPNKRGFALPPLARSAVSLPSTAIGKEPASRGASRRSNRNSTELTTGSAKRYLRKRSTTSANGSFSIDPSDSGRPPPPKPAWQQFSEHIKTFSAIGATYSPESSEFQKNMDNLIEMSGSDICKKILKDMKEQLERKRAKELLLLQKQQETEVFATSEIEELSDESDYGDDSDDEENEERKAKRRKSEAQRYWGIIRRDVQEKIRIRKEKNPAGGTWNALRSQLRALTRANNVRQELYEKYGIIPKAGSKVPEDTMKPALSINIKEVISRFQSFQVRKLKVTFV